jgi:hypothetical protein
VCRSSGTRPSLAPCCPGMSGSALECFDPVARPYDFRVLTLHNLPKTQAEVLLQRLLKLRDFVIFAGRDSSQHAAHVVSGQSVLQQDPATVQNRRRRPALVDILVVLVTELGAR